MEESSFTKGNIPPWAFFPFFKLQKWYQIAQSVYELLAPVSLPQLHIKCHL